MPPATGISSLLQLAAMAGVLLTRLTAKTAVPVPHLRVVPMPRQKAGQAAGAQMPNHLPRKRSMGKAESEATAVVAQVVRAAAYHRTDSRKAQA